MGHPRLIGVAVFIAAVVALTAFWHLYPAITLAGAVISLAMLIGLFWARGNQ